MKEFELEKLSREMPYKMPEHFLDDLTERVVAEIGREKRRHKQRRIYLMFASAAGVAAAAALLLLLPFGFSGTGTGVPDYETISQCTSIDEIFQSISTDDLGVYSMMSNYYGN